MNTDRCNDQTNAFAGGMSRHTALRRLAGAGAAAALLATAVADKARAQVTPAPRGEEANSFVLSNGETRIRYGSASERGITVLTYQGPFGSHNVGGTRSATRRARSAGWSPVISGRP